MGRACSRAVLSAVAALVFAGCSSGGGSSPPPPPPGSHVVTVSWAPNREAGVNQAGGGYRVDITGQPTVVVPWVSGALAPTTTDVTLATGSYTVTVTAFAALDAQGGATGSTSAPSQPFHLVVP